jgi:hypothetical protein
MFVFTVTVTVTASGLTIGYSTGEARYLVVGQAGSFSEQPPLIHSDAKETRLNQEDVDLVVVTAAVMVSVMFHESWLRQGPVQWKGSTGFWPPSHSNLTFA